VTDGARTRDLRSHNPNEDFLVRADRFHYVAYLSRKILCEGPVVHVRPDVFCPLLLPHCCHYCCRRRPHGYKLRLWRPGLHLLSQRSAFEYRKLVVAHRFSVLHPE